MLLTWKTAAHAGEWCR